MQQLHRTISKANTAPMRATADLSDQPQEELYVLDVRLDLVVVMQLSAHHL